MSITLTDIQCEKAKEDFFEFKTKELLRKDKSLTQEKALKEAQKSTIPERYYRQLMKETEGLLMIYLFDSNFAFNQKFTSTKNGEKKKEIKEKFKKYISKNNIDLNIPLVGYAIEFPPLKKDPGRVYYQGDYNLNIDENIDDENESQDELEGIEGILDYNEI